ncbi:hypothetical protein MYX82_05595 [Acidobacteria bacterium AH-259-D05]|nr:hypothetical protein [Acidobacteria bacterium AH-259-D05]
MMNRDEIRRVLLEVIQKHVGADYSLSTINIHNECYTTHGIRSLEEGQLLLSCLHDLFRIGYLAWGKDLSNPDLPWCHVTELGRRSIAQASRDPANPEGYLAHLRSVGKLDPTAESYITESLSTYNTGNFKASAVMTGVATEALIVSLRDVLVARMTSLGHAVPSQLNHWIVKRVLDVIQAALTPKKNSMSRNLAEAFDAHWPSLVHQIRTIRNDAGHPSSVDPVTEESVHAQLLIFPVVLDLALQLESWISTSYT